MIGMFFNIIFFIIILKRITMNGIISLKLDIENKENKLFITFDLFQLLFGGISNICSILYAILYFIN